MTARRSPRVFYVVLLALAAGVACERTGDAVVGGCVQCGLVCVSAPVVAVFKGEEARRKLECGACPSGQKCNMAFDDKAKCRPYPGEVGEVCASHSDGPGFVPFDCAPELYCDYDDNPRRCAKKKKRGEPCAGPVCVAELICRQLDSAEMRCQSPAKKGEPCGDQRDCATAGDDPALHCEDHKCVPTP